MSSSAKGTDCVTKRRPAAVTSNRSPINDLPISKDDIRDVFREEFAAMRQSLVSEFQKTLKDMVKSELRSIREDISALDKSVSFLSKEYDSFKKDWLSYSKSIHDLESQNLELADTVRDLTFRLQAMEINNRSSNLEMQCVPEHKSENLVTTVIQLSKIVGCELRENEIHHCTRVAKLNKEDNRPRSIIIKLSSPRVRDTLLAGVIKFNKSNPTDKLNTSHIGISGDKRPIFVSEHLSPSIKKLHAAARTMAKEKGYKFVWTRNGRVFVRKSENSPFIYIKDKVTIDKLP
ncbi:unnamed protein product [Euphydryas editha]|uniref:FP protein C-terminal domain-containing protein n=1 Tax=Euphydryas editha TaxID=104508 RepID=A0AAU9TMA5_EUPED|nr:unnamed protein product [Euphydryas editha]CAH2096034.1 unnamed protein product [Euphydryas editha]